MIDTYDQVRAESASIMPVSMPDVLTIFCKVWMISVGHA